MSTDFLPIPQPDGTVNVREETDGKVRRYVLTPGRFTDANTWEATDLSSEPDVVKQVAQSWFAAHETAYKAANPFVPPRPKSDNEVRNETFRADASRQELVEKLRNATPQQIDTYIDNKVTSLATAKDFLKQIVKVLAVAIRD